MSAVGNEAKKTPSYVNINCILHTPFYEIIGHRERSDVKMQELSLDILQYIIRTFLF